jgi:hypothetical protein
VNSLQGRWQKEAVDLLSQVGLERLPVRLILDRTTPAPTLSAPDPLVPFSVERDQREYRGTGGILRDLSDSLADDDYLLVANAAQILLQPLAKLAWDLAATGADVSILSQSDGTPSGLMLVRCGCLRLVPDVGYVDMKEQVLPEISRHYRVSVVERDRDHLTALPIRTLADYLRGLELYHRVVAGKPMNGNAFAEQWNSSFSIVEAGATVDPSARLHNAVVLRGGRVGGGAIVARSVVCPKGIVRRSSTVLNRLIGRLT